MSVIDVKVPDIGDFSDVPVIAILVAPGDTVEAEDPLVELESDKATMEVPSPQAGKVVAITVKEGDTVSEGSMILTLEVESAAEAPAEAKEPAAPTQAETAPAPVAFSGEKGDVHAEFLVLGSGPGGYTAAFRAADLGLKTVLIERDPMSSAVSA